MRNYFLDNLWRWKCGLPEKENKSKLLNYDDLKKSEWSDNFEKLMRNRLIMGAFRYGKLNEKNKPVYDRTTEIKKRCNKYIDTGNIEFLVDIANMCMLEFEEGKHKNKHFLSIDDGEHTQKKSVPFRYL
jgi:hypothetical protein